MQHLMKLLENQKYVHWRRVEDGSDVVRSIFWAHPDSIKLFNDFPTVVLLDSTYKTNKYRIPLLEMVGVTLTNLTYNIAFAYMSNERFDEVVWALTRLKGLIRKDDNLPKVIVTDKDNGLVNAVEEIFPTSRHFLCQFHISKNVTAKSKTLYKCKDFRAEISDIWKRLMHAPSEQEYVDQVGALQGKCGEKYDFITYVDSSWLLVRHKFVKF